MRGSASSCNDHFEAVDDGRGGELCHAEGCSVRRGDGHVERDAEGGEELEARF